MLRFDVMFREDLAWEVVSDAGDDYLCAHLDRGGLDISS